MIILMIYQKIKFYKKNDNLRKKIARNGKINILNYLMKVELQNI